MGQSAESTKSKIPNPKQSPRICSRLTFPDPGCDLQIDGPCIAALHARLTLAGDCVTLADLDSGSGTSLGPGGPRLPAHQPTEIQDGDEIWLGPEVRIALRRT